MRKLIIFLLILLGLLLAVVPSLFKQLDETVKVEDLPWHVTVFPDGSSEVFGVHLGQTTLHALAQRLENIPEVGLFIDTEGYRSLEAYFGRVRLGVLEAKLVARLQVSPELLDGFEATAVNNEPMPSGARKLELTEDNLKQAFELPVSELTYAPYAQYDAELVKERFGEPEERFAVSDTGEYWLYPQLGLALLLDTEGKEFLEYVPPVRFPEAVDRLRRQADQAAAQAGA